MFVNAVVNDENEKEGALEGEVIELSTIVGWTSSVDGELNKLI